MHKTPTNAVEAFIFLPLLELVISVKRGQLHNVWEVGSTYIPIGDTAVVLMRLQQSDPIFNMGVDAVRPVFNFEPKYRATMLTREDWTKGTGTLPVVKGLVWFTDGSKMNEGNGSGVFGQPVDRRLSFSLGRYATVSQADICPILACVYEFQSQNRPKKYVSICSDSQSALKALQAVRTASLLSDSAKRR